MVKISLAPMIDVTTPSFRKLIRITSTSTTLFSEMIVDKSILYMEENLILKKIGDYDSNTVIQIGGYKPEEVSKAIQRIHKLTGYKTFNLNCGCPSSKVQKGKFGALLMLEAERVVNIIQQVYEDTGFVISVKCRIGVDENEDFEFFENFIRKVSENTECKTFYVHARKCLLNGISPHKNRVIPPLNYEFVYKIKDMYPHLEIHLNGGIKDLTHIKNLDGLMIGREAIRNPLVFSQLENKQISEEISSMVDLYIKQFGKDEVIRMAHVIPIMNILKGKANSKKYRSELNLMVKERITFLDFEERIIKKYLLIYN